MKAFAKLLAHLNPAEILCLCFFLLSLILSAIFGYKYIIPDESSGQLLDMLYKTMRYAVLWSLAFLIALASKAMHAEKNRWLILARGLNFFRYVAAFILAGYLMIIFKWWAHYNSALWDPVLMYSDNSLIWLKNIFATIDAYLALPRDLYGIGYYFSFVIIYFYCTVFAHMKLPEVITLTIAVMLIGGSLYMPMPAYGPFIYDAKLSDEIQLIMREMTVTYRKHNGRILTMGYFEAPVGAMPSLHVAHVLALGIYAVRLNKYLAVLYAPLFIYICIYASVTKFHYIADIFGGIAVAGLALLVTELLFKRYYMANRMHGENG